MVKNSGSLTPCSCTVMLITGINCAWFDSLFSLTGFLEPAAGHMLMYFLSSVAIYASPCLRGIKKIMILIFPFYAILLGVSLKPFHLLEKLRNEREF